VAEPIRVLVADDHAVVREGLRTFLELQDGIEVVGDAADGEEAIRVAEALVPDVVLMDLVMPRMTGLQATAALLAVQPEARVVMLTGSFSPAAVREAHALGAKGFVLKEEDPALLPDIVRAVAAGGSAWSSPAVARLVAV
jgi:DNA-binding NarL/FixJ family response regulator